jgi:anti-sigma B factor antagonist
MVSSYEQASDANGPPDGPRVRIAPVQSDGQRVALSGEIDIANVGDAEAALMPMAASGSALVIDLAGLTYCDSQGIAMLFRLARHARDNGSSFTVANPQGIVARVFEITRFDEAVDVVIDL